MTLGVRGKWCMWRALQEVQHEYGPLAALDLDTLMQRAEAQFTTLEWERVAAGRRALANEVAAARD